MSDTAIIRAPLTGSAAWRGEDLTPADYLYELSAKEIGTIEALRDDLMERGLGLGQIDPKTVPVPGMASAIAEWSIASNTGSGSSSSAASTSPAGPSVRPGSLDNPGG